MTFCLAMKVEDGLVAIADTRITTGSEVIAAKKISTYTFPAPGEELPRERPLDPAAVPVGRVGGTCFVMTSGLRSARDKALTYFEDAVSEMSSGDPETDTPGRLFEIANLFAKQLRRVRKEDGDALAAGNLSFNTHALLGGQMHRDAEHRLYLIYPEGNWVEIERDSPYQIIGASGYGKPVLDRTLKYHDPMRFALKVGCLAFDSTRISAADVGPPIDVVLYKRDGFRCLEHRLEMADLAEITNWWQDRLRTGIRQLPTGWLAPLMGRIPPDWGDVLSPVNPDEYGG